MGTWMILWGLFACTPHTHGDEGHDHGSEDAGHGHGHAEASIAITRWTPAHELFVELDAPVVGHTFDYHAHVTRMADNHAATEGRLTIRFDLDGNPIETHTDEAVARAGIFASTAKSPSIPGTYRLVFVYENGDETATWDGGQVEVPSGHAGSYEGQDEGEITFLKETQWQIPFAVAPAALESMAPTITAPAIAESAPGTTTVVAAPVDGLLAWNDTMPVVGSRVRKGAALAMLVPAGSSVHWSSIQAELATARSEVGLAEQELERVQGLVSQSLLPLRRLEQAQSALQVSEARLSAAQRQASSLTTGGAGAVTVRAPADGLIVAVGAEHGERVGAGLPLFTVASGDALLLHGHVHDRTWRDLSTISSLSVQRGGQAEATDLLAVGAELLTHQLVFEADTLSAPIAVLVEANIGLSQGDLVELRVGVGEGTPRLAVPLSSVVEINGQNVLFVQQTGESFTRRRVTLGVRDAERVEVLSGLKPGEMVVVEGGFDVHVASLSGALESHTH